MMRDEAPAWAGIAFGLGLSAASAVLLTLAFPPSGLWPLIWVGFVPMLVAQYRLLPARVSSLAPATAIGGWLGGYLGPIFGGTGSYMAWLPLAVGAVVLLADSGKRAFHERTGYRWFVLEGAMSWVGLEMVRSRIPLFGTWALVGNSLYAQPWLIQPVSVFGLFGLGLVILLVNYALGLAVVSWPLGDARMARLSRRWLASAGVAFAAWVALSLLEYNPPAGATVAVAAVQVPGRRANNTGYEQDPARRATLFGQLQEQTREAARQGAQIVVWPEGALNVDPQAESAAELRALATQTGVYLALGYMIPLPDGSWRNEATVISPQGEFLGVFGKDHPVLFGGERNTSLGLYPVYETSAGRLGTIICYDLDFTDTARKLAEKGAQIIAVPSLDWPAIADKHYTHLVFRAIENRVAFVKGDGGYDSAIVDAYGRMIGRTVTPQGEMATLVAKVPLGPADALEIRLGDWLGWLCLAGLLFFALYRPLSGRRSRGERG